MKFIHPRVRCLTLLQPQHFLPNSVRPARPLSFFYSDLSNQRYHSCLAVHSLTCSLPQPNTSLFTLPLPSISLQTCSTPESPSAHPDSRAPRPNSFPPWRHNSRITKQLALRHIHRLGFNTWFTVLSPPATPSATAFPVAVAMSSREVIAKATSPLSNALIFSLLLNSQYHSAL